VSVAVGAAATPVPVKKIVCGEPAALSVIVTAPVLVPATVGSNVTETEQVPAGATEAPQVFVSAKSPEFAITSVRVPLPELVSVTVCASVVTPIVVEAKVRLDDDRAITGRGAMAVPLSATVCGEPAALSMTVSVPVRVPTAVGANVTEIVHVPSTATLVPQVLVWAKSPEIVSGESVSSAVPELVNVIV